MLTKIQELKKKKRKYTIHSHSLYTIKNNLAYSKYKTEKNWMFDYLYLFYRIKRVKKKKKKRK